MNVTQLVETVSTKTNFLALTDYITFCERYLDFTSSGLQAVIVSQNENQYQFYQYREDGFFNITRPLNAGLIGSVKTSSKDRLDKIFVDKFLYSRLTDTALPHIAVFLHDVQRKKTKRENVYGISATFLPGHFKGYTIKLNPLDGVYYCDIRPNMRADPLLEQHIRTIDDLFVTDIWRLLE